MAKLIYIRCSYDTGIVLPMAALEHLKEAILVKTSGYSELKDPITHPESVICVQFIDSQDINKNVNKERQIKDARETLQIAQNNLDSLEKYYETN